MENVCTIFDRIRKTLCTTGIDTSGPVDLFFVSVKCTCNISPDRNVFDTRELGHLLTHPPAAFYNNYKYMHYPRKNQEKSDFQNFYFLRLIASFFMLTCNISNNEKLTYMCVV